MDYIEYNFKVSPLQPGCEILIAELAEAGFESFTETPEGLSAYIQKNLWSPEILDDIYILKSKEFTITFDLKEIAPINWNEEWERISIRSWWRINVRYAPHFTPNPKWNMISLSNPKCLLAPGITRRPS